MRILGPVEVRDDDGRVLEVGGRKQRALLAALALEAGRVVSVDRLVDRIWGEDVPPAPMASLQVYVSQLRRMLEPDRPTRQPATVLVTRTPGYVLQTDVVEVDADVLVREVSVADGLLAQGRAEEAVMLVDAAERLWRGDPLGDLADLPEVTAEVERLATIRWRARDLHIDALLAAGRAAAAVELAERSTVEQPYREHGWVQLMTAYYRCGRAAEALRAYQRCRNLFADELGLDVGPQLQQLEDAILRHDIALLGAVRTPAPATPTPTRLALAAETSVPTLFGRDRELAIVLDALTAAMAGRLQVVSIEGEAGIGKTTLVRTALRRSEELGACVAWGRGIPDLGAPSLWVWDQVTSALGIAAPLSEPSDGAVDTASVDPGGERFRRLTATVTALRAASASKPVVIVLDDLQWVDDDSIALLRLLVSDDSAKCLVLVTVRPGEASERPTVADALVGIGRHAHGRRLVLRPLSGLDVAAYLRASEHPALAARASDLHRRSGGNPFLLTELCRFVAAEDVAIDQALPVTVRDVVDRHLADLGTVDGPMVKMAALAGSTVDLDVLAVAAERDVDEVATALERAVTVGILREDSGVGWGFAHDLTRDAVTAALAPHVRRRVHTRLADAVAEVHADDLERHLDDIARHRFHAAGGRPSTVAFDACTAAADASVRRLAFAQAAAHRERAVQVLPSGLAHATARIDALLALTRERRLCGDVVGASAALEATLQAVRASDDRTRLSDVLAVLGEPTLWNWRAYGVVDNEAVASIESVLEETRDPHRRAELLGTLAVEQYYTGRTDVTDDLTRQAIELARTLDDPALLGRTLNNRTIGIWRPDREDERFTAATEALRFAGRGLPLATEAIARMHRLSIALRFGDLVTYRDDLRRCGPLVEAVALPELDAQRMYQLAGCAVHEGRVEEADELAERAYDLQCRTSLWGAQWCRMIQRFTRGRDHGGLETTVAELIDLASDPAYGMLRPTAVLTLIELGDSGEAATLARRWELGRELGPPDWTTDSLLVQLAEVAAAIGIPNPATMRAALAPYAERIAVAGTAVACWGSTHGTLGRLAARLGDGVAAVAHLRAAIEVDGRIGLAAGERRARATLAAFG